MSVVGTQPTLSAAPQNVCFQGYSGRFLMQANMSATSAPSRAQKAYLCRMGCLRLTVQMQQSDDIDDGKMDGFVAVAATAREACKNTMDPNCGGELNPEFEIAGLGPQRVMAYHVESDIPNYWAYAREFVLQNRMFEPVAS